jgi:uncharacterized membrane-anchored protein
MIALPRLVLIILVMFVVWYAVRWLNRAPTKIVRRQQAPSPQPQQAVEDLTACQTCGAYVVASARGCGKPGCPQPL